MSPDRASATLKRFKKRPTNCQTGTGGAWGFAHTSDDFAMFLLFIGFSAAYISIFINFVPPSNYNAVAGVVGFLFTWVAVNRGLLYLG